MTRVCAAALAVVAILGPVDARAQDDDYLEGIGFVLGSADAPVQVVEFADFACSACAQFARDTWPALRDRYVLTGLVQWQVIAFELGFPNSDEGARTAQCAAEQDRFWPMHDALYLRQPEWVGLRKPAAALLALADSIGLDARRFEACYDDDPRKEETDRANRAARRHGVRGTPTFLVGDVRVHGALPIETFAQIIEGRLR